jgi:hypothetical protein
MWAHLRFDEDAMKIPAHGVLGAAGARTMAVSGGRRWVSTIRVTEDPQTFVGSLSDERPDFIHKADTARWGGSPSQKILEVVA